MPCPIQTSEDAEHIPWPIPKMRSVSRTLLTMVTQSLIEFAIGLL